MELKNDFRVGVDRATAWKALTDLERIAPLLPGAQLQEIEGDDYRGIVKVKVGPIQAQYKGTATLVETDEAAGRMVMKASGRDTRGAGNASATITVTVADDGGGTRVNADTDLTITGKVAQFGRGVLMDVSTKLIGQFADNLEKELSTVTTPSEPTPTSDAGTPATNGAVGAVGGPAEGDVGPGTTAPIAGEETTTSSRTPNEPAPSSPTASGARRIDSPDPEPVDLFEAAGNPMLKRIAPLVGGLVAVAVFLVLRRRRKASRLDAVRSRIPSSLPSVPDLPDAERYVGQARKLSKKAAKKAAKQAGRVSHSAGDVLGSAGEVFGSAGEVLGSAGGALGSAAKAGRHVAHEVVQESGKRAKQARKEAKKAAKVAAKRAGKVSDKANLKAGSAAGAISGVAAGVGDNASHLAGRASRRVARSTPHGVVEDVAS